jgi:plastocyanin
MKRAFILLIAAALAVLGLVACGGDDDDGAEMTAAEQTTTSTQPSGGGGGATTLRLSAPADGSLAYNTDSLQAKAGNVMVDFDNPSSLSHDVVIEDQSGSEVGKTELVAQGQTSVTVDLQPGTFTYFCDVPGHREGGMEGTLTVK